MSAERRPAVPPPPPVQRVKARWLFLAAIVLGALAIFVLPTPFGGIAALLCVVAFLSGCVQYLRGADPEMVHHADRAGLGGWG